MSYHYKKIIPFIFFLVALISFSNALNSSSGAKFPGAVNQYSEMYLAPYYESAIQWIDLENVKIIDNINVTLPMDLSESVWKNISYTMNMTHFNFSIPESATIQGYEVFTKRNAQSTLEGCTEGALHIQYAGERIGDNKAILAAWQNPANETAVHGSKTDLWGINLAPSEINDDSFGLLFIANGTENVNVTCMVDAVYMNIYYSELSNCTNPVENMNITEDTIFCPGTYYLNDSDRNGVIRIKDDDVTLDCNGALIYSTQNQLTTYTIGIMNDGYNRVNVKYCNVTGYFDDILYTWYTLGGNITNNVIKDSREGITLSYGVDGAYIYGNTCYDSDQCIHVADSRNILISQNSFYNTTKDTDSYDTPVIIEKDANMGVSTVYNKNITIINNVFSNLTSGGILIVGGNGIYIYDNTFVFLNFSERGNWNADDQGEYPCAIAISSYWKNFNQFQNFYGLPHCGDTYYTDTLTCLLKSQSSNINISNNYYNANTQCYVNDLSTVGLSLSLTGYPYYLKGLSADYGMFPENTYYVNNATDTLQLYNTIDAPGLRNWTHKKYGNPILGSYNAYIYNISFFRDNDTIKNVHYNGEDIQLRKFVTDRYFKTYLNGALYQDSAISIDMTIPYGSYVNLIYGNTTGVTGVVNTTANDTYYEDIYAQQFSGQNYTLFYNFCILGGENANNCTKNPLTNITTCTNTGVGADYICHVGAAVQEGPTIYLYCYSDDLNIEYCDTCIQVMHDQTTGQKLFNPGRKTCAQTVTQQWYPDLKVTCPEYWYLTSMVGTPFFMAALTMNRPAFCELTSLGYLYPVINASCTNSIALQYLMDNPDHQIYTYGSCGIRANSSGLGNPDTCYNPGLVTCANRYQYAICTQQASGVLNWVTYDCPSGQECAGLSGICETPGGSSNTNLNDAGFGIFSQNISKANKLLITIIALLVSTIFIMGVFIYGSTQSNSNLIPVGAMIAAVVDIGWFAYFAYIEYIDTWIIVIMGFVAAVALFMFLRSKLFGSNGGPGGG